MDAVEAQGLGPAISGAVAAALPPLRNWQGRITTGNSDLSFFLQNDCASRLSHSFQVGGLEPGEAKVRVRRVGPAQPLGDWMSTLDELWWLNFLRVHYLQNPRSLLQGAGRFY